MNTVTSKIVSDAVSQSAQMKDLDRLGLLQAQIAELTEQAEVIKDAFKNAGEGKYEGDLYKASVSMSARNTVDYKTLLADLNVSDELIAKYTKQSVSIAIRVTAR
jgi:hypothetical protein